MSLKLIPIFTSLILSSGTLAAALSDAPPTKIENITPDAYRLENPHHRTILFEPVYPNNHLSIQQVGVPRTQDVGELQERWQFPSDHLPIGMTIDDLNFASWNVLNSEYMNWIENNTQGLARSLITQEHIYVGGTGLTMRDLHVIENITSMLGHPTHPRSVISLQECSQAFIEELQRQLPAEYGIVLSSESPRIDQNIAIYDKRSLAFDPAQSHIQSGIFSLQPNRTVMNLCFIEKEGAKQTIRVINAHLPGEPGNPAPKEFAAYVASLSSSDILTIAMGDMNFNEVEMGNAFEKETPPGMELTIIAPYCTNIGLNLYSKSIDHFFVLTQGEHAISKNSAEEVLIGLDETVDLIDPDFFICGENT